MIYGSVAPATALGQPAASREGFEARIAGKPNDLTYLRTGDAGVLADGELYVLGRYKDAIILNGVNHQPEPIEATVSAASTAHRLGAVAAVGVSIDGRERLVVVAEVAGRSPLPSALAQVCRELRAVVHRAHDLAVHTVVLVRHLSLPRTTSGKVRRHRVKELFLSAGLHVLQAESAALAAGDSANARGVGDDGTDFRAKTG